jgi:hypothetical protein
MAIELSDPHPQPHWAIGLAGFLVFLHMAAGQFQEFALTSPFPYTCPITRHSILSEGADYGNAHDIPLR